MTRRHYNQWQNPHHWLSTPQGNWLSEIFISITMWNKTKTTQTPKMAFLKQIMCKATSAATNSQSHPDKSAAIIIGKINSPD